MANTITGFNTFVANTLIKSADVNSNFTNVKDNASIWQKFTIAHTGVNTASAAFTATVMNLEPLEVINGMIVKHSTAFTGGSVTAIDLAIGVAGENDKHVDSFSVFQAVTETAHQIINLNSIESFGSTTTVYARFTSTGSNLDSLTAGSVDIYILKNILP